MNEHMQAEDYLILEDYLTLKGTLRCVTGLHIGGASDTIEIGGLDLPVIRHPITRLPYVPGSSLKGKLRSLLELRLGMIDPRIKIEKDGEVVDNGEYGEVHKPGGYKCSGADCPICRIFGSGAEKGKNNIGPGRLIVRDAYLTKEWEDRIESLMKSGQSVTEVKHENTINRITSKANPRQIERVPAGVSFAFEIGYRVFSMSNAEVTDRALFTRVIEGLRLVAADTLGGSGSRGYGKVTFEDLVLTNFDGEEIFTGNSLDEWDGSQLPECEPQDSTPS